jgi:hypothetical protein
MRLSELLLNLVIGSVLFVVYVLEFILGGDMHPKRPAKVRVPVLNPHSALYPLNKHDAGNKWDMR